MNATVRIPTPLRKFANGSSEVTVTGGTVGEALTHLGDTHEGLRQHLLDGDGQVRSFVNVYLGDTNIRELGGLDTPLGDGPVISLIPAVAGGRR